MAPRDLLGVGGEIILANTYHLLVLGSGDVIEEAGGLHGFMAWDRPMLTDSGGFQIFSLGGHGTVTDEVKRKRVTARPASLLALTEEGAKFRSYRNGAALTLTPESSVALQRQLGADLIMPLDECTSYHDDRGYTESSMRRSHRWEERSLQEFERGNDGRQALYGIVQGGKWEDLRRESAQWVSDQPFFGVAIGGPLGDHADMIVEQVAQGARHATRDRPMHILGIGGIPDILANVRANGADTFDCVQPTRLARHGWALFKGTRRGRLNIRNAAFRHDRRPVDESCLCPSCRDFSRSYLHHLMHHGELLGMQALAIHNAATMMRLMRDIRAAIPAGTLPQLEKEWLEGREEEDKASA